MSLKPALVNRQQLFQNEKHSSGEPEMVLKCLPTKKLQDINNNLRELFAVKKRVAHLSSSVPNLQI